jgi:hypothetical protein
VETKPQAVVVTALNGSSYLIQARSRVHVHNSRCKHDQVKDAGSVESCATSQLLHSLSAAAKRCLGSGTMHHKLLQANATFCEALVPPELASGAIYGLKRALGRVLQVPNTFRSATI